MTELYKFASECPWTFLALAYLVIELLRRSFIRFTRMVMVTVRGWPPYHIDADGDWNPNLNQSTDDATFNGE